MRATKLTLGLLAAGFAILGVVLLVQRQSATRLRAEVDDLRRQNRTLADLRAEHERLSGQQIPADELQRLRDDHEAIRRLHSEIDDLKNRPIAPAPVAPASSVVLVPASAWKNAGRATPASAFESVLWAATHGEVDALIGMLDFRAGGADRKLEELFTGLPAEVRAQYDSPQKLFATLLAAQISPGVAAMGVVPQEGIGTKDATIIKVQLEDPQGRQKDTTYGFVRYPDGWRFVVPSLMVASYAQLLPGATAAPAPIDQPKTGG
jgi:hypothetical protein